MRREGGADGAGGGREVEGVRRIEDVPGLGGENECPEMLFTGVRQCLEQRGERPACRGADVNDGLAMLHRSPMFGIKSR